MIVQTFVHDPVHVQLVAVGAKDPADTDRALVATERQCARIAAGKLSSCVFSWIN